MFNRLLIPILLFCTSVATAQVSPEAYDQLVNSLLRAQTPTTSKTTATRQRVIAESNFMLTGPGVGLMDSIRYQYSGGRGSEFNIWSSYYSHAYLMYYHYRYSTTMTHASDPDWAPLDPDVKCDSFFLYTAGQAGALYPQQGNRFYNADGSIRQAENYYFFDGQKPSLGDHRVHNLHDGQGRLSYSSNTSYQPSWGWGTVSDKFLFYDAAGHLTGDSQNLFNPVSLAALRHFMTYDAGGKLTAILLKHSYSGVWEDTRRFDISYYPSGQLQRIVTMEYSNGNPYFMFADSFVYTPGIGLYAERYWRDTLGYRRRTVRHFNARQLIDTIRDESSDSANGIWSLDGQTTWWYNSIDNPVEAVYESAPAQNQILHRYYYEEYETQGVEEVHAAYLKIYPNPVAARGVLHIDAGTQKGTLAITDVAGRTLKQVQIRGKGVQAVPVSELQPGLYFYRLYDDRQGRCAGKFLVE